MDARSPDGLGYGSFSASVKGLSPRLPRIEGPLCVEIRRAGDMRAVTDAWRHLMPRALEPSVFAEPGFLLPALQHLPEGPHVAMLCVWQGPPEKSMLRGLFPVLAPRLSFAGRDVRIWRPPLSFGNPALVDGDFADAVLEALVADLSDRGAARLLFPQVPLQGNFAAVLRAFARRPQRPLEILELNDSLQDGPTAEALDRPGPRIGSDRLWERLSERGEVRIERAQEARAVRDAVEEFLVLEALARGSAALIRDVGTASFVRTMTRELARSRRCRVDVMRIGGKPVAAAIILKSAQRAWLWKIACDDRLAACAPDALLALEGARTRRKHMRLEIGDACGLRDHPVVDHLRRERTPCGDVLIPVRPAPAPTAQPLRASPGMVRTLRLIAQQA